MADDDFPVLLNLQDADHLLALAEAVLNTPLPERPPLGPGLRWYCVEEAARKIEAVAAMVRQGVRP